MENNGAPVVERATIHRSWAMLRLWIAFLAVCSTLDWARRRIVSRCRGRRPSLHVPGLPDSARFVIKCREIGLISEICFLLGNKICKSGISAARATVRKSLTIIPRKAVQKPAGTGNSVNNPILTGCNKLKHIWPKLDLFAATFTTFPLESRAKSGNHGEVGHIRRGCATVCEGLSAA